MRRWRYVVLLALISACQISHDRFIGIDAEPIIPDAGQDAALDAGDVAIVAICGNGIVEPGEVCDDTNTLDGDGCSSNCSSNESCGKHIIDTAVGETCDPPGVGGCGLDCRSALTCGNAITDPGEECDTGASSNNSDCRADCVTNRCGDGFVNSTATH